MDELSIIEQSVPVRCVRVIGRCPVCGAELVRAPRVLTSAPPVYVYVCNNCKEEFSSMAQYPRIVYEPIEEKNS